MAPTTTTHQGRPLRALLTLALLLALLGVIILNSAFPPPPTALLLRHHHLNDDDELAQAKQAIIALGSWANDIMKQEDLLRRPFLLERPLHHHHPSQTPTDVTDGTVIDGKPLYLLKACPDPAIVPTSEWSCIRRVSQEELNRRDPELYGFQESDWATHPYKDDYNPIGVGNPRDRNDDWQIANQLHLTGGTGYALTDIPEDLFAELRDYLENASSSIQEAPLRFDNGHVHPKSMVYLSTGAHGMTSRVSSGLRRVLEQWTHQALESTAVYGIRIYPKDSVLINHVDRKETHVASAILQIAQQTDVGWPLELIEPDGSVIEVYMQPGQMLLYEGSRVPHGRTRRFEGDSFANIFAHYKPKDWTYDAELSKELDEKAYQVQQQGQTQ